MAVGRAAKLKILLSALLMSIPLPAPAADPPSRPIVAILPFSGPQDQPLHKWLGDYIPTLLTTDLAGLPGVRIAERAQIDALLREIELSLSPAAEEGKLRAGVIAVATHYVLGTFAVTDNRIRVDVRITEVQSGTIEAAFSEEGGLDGLGEVSARAAAAIARCFELELPRTRSMAGQMSMKGHRTLFRAQELWDTLPFHELHPRRLRNKADYQAMTDQLMDLLEDAPGHGLASFLCGEFNLQLGLHEEARGFFEAIQQPGASPVLAAVGLGDLYRFTRAFQKSAQFYGMALELDGGNAAAHYGIARCLIETDAPDRAAYHVVRLLELRPDLLVAFGLADALISSGGRACPPAAPTPACQVLAGLSLLKANHYPEAARILEPIVASFPDLHTIPFASGVVAYLGRDYRQAERQLERALSLYPTHAQTRLYLGHVLFDSGRHLQALPHYRAYLTLSKEGADFGEIRRRIRICEAELPAQ
jgi:tetratricopeptide (TPR) repeat protein/TolB-like protein